jgi:hypothetical protein
MTGIWNQCQRGEGGKPLVGSKKCSVGSSMPQYSTMGKTTLAGGEYALLAYLYCQLDQFTHTTLHCLQPDTLSEQHVVQQGQSNSKFIRRLFPVRLGSLRSAIDKILKQEVLESKLQNLVLSGYSVTVCRFRLLKLSGTCRQLVLTGERKVLFQITDR